MDNEKAISELFARVNSLEEEIKSNKEAHVRIYDRIIILENNNSRVDERLENICRKFDDLKMSIKEIKEEIIKDMESIQKIIEGYKSNHKNWLDFLIKTVIALVIAGIGGIVGVYLIG